jgi:hypothetical protein
MGTQRPHHRPAGDAEPDDEVRLGQSSPPVPTKSA